MKNLQTWNRRGWIIAILLMIFVLGACSNVEEKSSPPQSPPQASSENRTETADFKLQGLNDKTIDSSIVNKPMFLSFWATWCHFCKEEMPYIDKLAQEYEGRVEFAAINLTHLDSVKDVEAYVQKNKYQIPIYLDQDGQVTNSFRVLSTPTFILLDHQGNLAYKKIGAAGENGTQAYRDILDNLIEEMN